MALYYRFLFRIIHWFSDSLILWFLGLRRWKSGRWDCWLLVIKVMCEFTVCMCVCVRVCICVCVCEWESEFVFLYWYVSKRLICIWFISPIHSLCLCSLAFDWCFEKLHRTVRGAHRTRKNDILTGLQPIEPNWKHAGHIEASFPLRSHRFIHFN